MQGASADSNTSLRPGLRQRAIERKSPDSPLIVAKDPKRDHHRKERLEQKMEADTGQSSDEQELGADTGHSGDEQELGADTGHSGDEQELGADCDTRHSSDDVNGPNTKDTDGDRVKTARITFSLSYGARAENTVEGDAVEFFVCDSSGVKSPSQHLKETHKVKVPFGFLEVDPIITGMLTRLTIRVDRDPEKHKVARPLPDAIFLDQTAAALRYHKLEVLEPDWSCRDSVVSICVFDKV
jgi:hypothetical protein